MSMQLVGMCHICGRPAMQACAMCGLLTCPECLDPATGMCRDCMMRFSDGEEIDLDDMEE